MKVNGVNVEIPTVLFLNDFLRQQGYEPSHVAVERNGEIVAKGSFDSVKIMNSDKLEIVKFVGGG